MFSVFLAPVCRSPVPLNQREAQYVYTKGTSVYLTNDKTRSVPWLVLVARVPCGRVSRAAASAVSRAASSRKRGWRELRPPMPRTEARSAPFVCRRFISTRLVTAKGTL